jgi:hypothetical protein
MHALCICVSVALVGVLVLGDGALNLTIDDDMDDYESAGPHRDGW